MNSINIKVHPPWYARGTPVINPRDGPAMALSDKPFFAIREGPSARGKPKVKTCFWLTLKTVFFNMQNGMYSHWYAVKEGSGNADFGCINAVKSKDVDRLEERSADDFGFDLSVCKAPDNI